MNYSIKQLNQITHLHNRSSVMQRTSKSLKFFWQKKKKQDRREIEG